jgi:hypothetical protein
MNRDDRDRRDLPRYLLPPDFGYPEGYCLSGGPTGSHKNVETVHQIAAPIRRLKHFTVVRQISFYDPNDQGRGHGLDCITPAFGGSYRSGD